MSDDLEEQLRRAARAHAARNDANGRARKTEEHDRADLLVKFHDLSRNVIEPELNGAKKTIEAPGKVTAKIRRSDDENEIALELTDGRKSSILVFVADPILMQVRVHSTVHIELDDLNAVTEWRDAIHGTGDNPVRVTMSLEDLTPAAIKFYATEFGVRALA